jgi:AhpC/TSA antioxidant enzyme
MVSAAVQRLVRHLLVAVLAAGGCGIADAFQPLQGVQVRAVRDGSDVDIGKWMEGTTCLVVFGTYAADFNAIEYAQRLRYYLPRLTGAPNRPVDKCAFLVNGQPSAAAALAKLVDLPDSVELWVDNEGRAGRKFGVSRGWLPDNCDVHPFLKLFGMLWGLGAWATLPAVIGGYLGNPFQGQPWIQDALEVGQRMGRWPDTALDISENGSGGGIAVVNKFDALPVVGSWPRRPLELATLRLQSMLGISLKNWDRLAPDPAALDAGVLTQLGGCLVVDGSGEVLYKWKDPGICAVANFEDILKKL